MTASNLFYQVINHKDSETITVVIYWALWLMMFAGTIISKVKDKPDYVNYIIVITLIRNVIPMLDMDQKRLKLDLL